MADILDTHHNPLWYRDSASEEHVDSHRSGGRVTRVVERTGQLARHAGEFRYALGRGSGTIHFRVLWYREVC